MRYEPVQWVFLACTLLAMLLTFVISFSQIHIQNNTLAMDWKTFRSLLDANLVYLPLDGLRFPPWFLVPLLPPSFLSMQTSWGILAGISFIILVLSVPRICSKTLFFHSLFHRSEISLRGKSRSALSYGKAGMLIAALFQTVLYMARNSASTLRFCFWRTFSTTFRSTVDYDRGSGWGDFVTEAPIR